MAGTIAILGGAGAVGRGLAWRWAKAGHRVVIGSREIERAVAAADAVRARVSTADVRGVGNLEAAEAGEIVVLAVPFAHQLPTLEVVRAQLAGKILIDVTVPLQPPKVATVQMPKEGSAAVIAQNYLGESVKVVSAFHDVGAKHLEADHPIDCDVLIAGDDPTARKVVVDLVNAAGMRGIEAGPLANSTAMEAMTSVLIWINRKYKVDNAGLRITGLP